MENESEYKKYTPQILMIAKFIGIEPIKGISEHTGEDYYYYNDEELEGFEALPFYDTWNTLMPVVKKIQKLEVEDSDKTRDVIYSLLDVEIQSLFNAIIVFLEWWNKEGE